MQKYDDNITVKKKSINMKDLSALTAQTGCEFAMFTKGNERLIIRGNEYSVNINEEVATKMAGDGYKWSGHTHPGIDFNCLFASPGDEKILNCFKQNLSVIYNSQGKFNIIDKG